MCTAISYNAKRHYFGRNLDLEYSYEETVTITPRNYCFHYANYPQQQVHYAMIGMAYVKDGYPLYYDATNEKGLSMAGLYFPGNACYRPVEDGVREDGTTEDGKIQIATFELIPWLLGQCADVGQARIWLEKCVITDNSFRSDLPATALHWMVADAKDSIVVEAVKEGVKIYDNPVGVLTNNPPFPFHLTTLNQYMNLSAQPAVNRFAEGVDLQAYSKGMGALGLPGDMSSVSRFVRAVFVKGNSVCGGTEEEEVGQFFHILGSVEQPRGCVRLEDNLYMTTRYTSCCDTEKCIYYYTTYENRQITAVDMFQEDLDGDKLYSHRLVLKQQIAWG